MSADSDRRGPFVVVRVAGARLALPIEVVARMEPQESTHQVDLGQQLGLCDDAPARPAAVALKTAAGIVNAAMDGLEDLVAQAEVLPLPPLVRLTVPGAVQGLILHQGRSGPVVAVLLDGDALGDRIAERILTEPT